MAKTLESKDIVPWIIVALSVVTVLQLFAPILENAITFMGTYMKTVIMVIFIVGASFTMFWTFLGVWKQDFTLTSTTAIVGIAVGISFIFLGMFAPMLVTFSVVQP